jgi:hypothetical protein
MGIRAVSRVLWSFTAVGALLVTLAGPGLAQSTNTTTSAAPANLAVADYDVPGVQIVLLSLKRGSDGYLTLRWAYRNTTTSPKTIGGDSTAMNGAWSANYSLAYDAYITAAGKQYQAVRTSGGMLAEKHGGTFASKTIVVGANQTYTTWAKFKDPGAEVSKVSVYLQGVPPFEDVPIS